MFPSFCIFLLNHLSFSVLSIYKLILELDVKHFPHHTLWQDQNFPHENHKFMQNISPRFFFTLPYFFQYPINLRNYRVSYPFQRDVINKSNKIFLLKLSSISLMSWLNNGPTIVGRTYFYLVTTVCPLFVLCAIASDLRAEMISWWIPSTVPCIPETIPTVRVHTHRIWREHQQVNSEFYWQVQILW